jgi:hypothetical protein
MPTTTGSPTGGCGQRGSSEASIWRNENTPSASSTGPASCCCCCSAKAGRLVCVVVVCHTSNAPSVSTRTHALRTLLALPGMPRDTLQCGAWGPPVCASVLLSAGHAAAVCVLLGGGGQVLGEWPACWPTPEHHARRDVSLA